MLGSDFYPMIFKRKSFHLFRKTGSAKVSDAELKEIETAFSSFERLEPDIKVEIRIRRTIETGMKRDAEYCILLYSEKKDNYLMNIGYLGQQLDLFLVSRNIGSLWLGLGKPDIKVHDNMEFVIMIAIHKVEDESLFRKDMFKAARKPVQEIWSGPQLQIADIVRFSPSACNSQPWFVKNDGKALTVFRYRKPGKIGIMSAEKAEYYNRIDIGIFLCILEVCLAQQKISAERTVFIDEAENPTEYSKVAEYRILLP